MATYRSEKDVKKHVKKTLDKHSWFWWMPPANAYGVTGVADILALRDGVFLAVETKYNGNKPTPMQRGFLDSITAQGGFGFCVDEKMLEWFDAWCAAFDRACEAQMKGEKPSPEDGATMLNAIKVMTELLHVGAEKKQP